MQPRLTYLTFPLVITYTDVRQSRHVIAKNPLQLE